MTDPSLDEVADRLAEPISLARAFSKVAARTEKVLGLPRPLAFVVGLPAVLLGWPGMLRAILRTPDRAETVRLYRDILGVDRDRAQADVAAVEARLALFLNSPEALVREAARWLVRWVAAGRPLSGADHIAIEERSLNYWTTASACTRPRATARSS